MAEEQEQNEPEVAVQENSSRWRPGQSGNPAGRPKRGDSIAELIRSTIDRPQFVEKLLKLAYEGDLQAMKLVLDYVEPLPKGNRTGLLGASGVQVIINYVPPGNGVMGANHGGVLAVQAIEGEESEDADG